MITHQEAQHLLNDVEYLPGWKIFWESIDGDRYSSLQWVFRAEDNTRQYCRKWLIDLHEATPSDIVQTALRAALDAQEHEVRETFRFKGKRIYGPHFNPDALVELAKYKKNLVLKDV